MSLFKKMFGRRDPLSRVQRAVDQGRWAEALTEAQVLQGAALSDEQRREVDTLRDRAGDGLAELNVDEGEACLRAGYFERAQEHFSLALEQGRDSALIERARAGMEKATAGVPHEEGGEDGGAHAGCTGSCSPGAPVSARGSAGGAMEGFDSRTRLELLVAAYPPGLAERYLEAGSQFAEAVLLAHEDRGEEALALLGQIPQEEHDDLYLFERGALRVRLGQVDGGKRDLKEAMSLNPDQLLAVKALVEMELAGHPDCGAEGLLRSLVERKVEPGACLGMLAALAARRGDLDTALEEGLSALEQGGVAAETVLLTAGLLEKRQRLDEAEALFARISGGGCSGGANVHLAEFWLRHGRSADRAIEAFKGALRSEPDNPRWILRAGQAYLARGWRKQGLPMIRQAVAHPGLPEELRREGQALLDPSA